MTVLFGGETGYTNQTTNHTACLASHHRIEWMLTNVEVRQYCKPNFMEETEDRKKSYLHDRTQLAISITLHMNSSDKTIFGSIFGLYCRELKQSNPRVEWRPGFIQPGIQGEI
jgi:hypothetical protein